MVALTIELVDRELQRLEAAASKAGKTVEAFLLELIDRLPEDDADRDVSRDPLYDFTGYDVEAPPDLSERVDKTLYGRKRPV